MLTLRELMLSLLGVWQLAHFDAGGHALFDRSDVGARRSFFAAVLMAPPYALVLILAFRSGDGAEPARAAADPLRYALAETIAYVISWTAYPVAVEWLSRRLNCRERFAGYLSAYNWSMVLQNGAVLSFSLLALTHALPEDVTRMLWLVVFGCMLAWLWFIARTGLAVSASTAVGLVMLDVLLSAIIDSAAAALH